MNECRRRVALFALAVALGLGSTARLALAEDSTYLGQTEVVTVGSAPANCIVTRVKLVVTGDHYEYQDVSTNFRLSGSVQSDGSFSTSGTIGSFRVPVTATLKGRIADGRVEGTYTNSTGCAKSFKLARGAP